MPAPDVNAAAPEPSAALLALAHRIKGALTVWVRDVSLEQGASSVALSFEHPVNGATVMVVARPAAAAEAEAASADDDDNGAGADGATLGIYVVLGDFAAVRGDDDALLRLFGLNAELMSCAVGLLRLSEDEVAYALCRRLPAADVAVAEVRELVDAMIWEFAQAAGFVGEGS